MCKTEQQPDTHMHASNNNKYIFSYSSNRSIESIEIKIVICLRQKVAYTHQNSTARVQVGMAIEHSNSWPIHIFKEYSMYCMLWSILQERVSCISGRKLIALDWLQCFFTKRKRKKRVNKWFTQKKLWFTAVNILCSRFCCFCCLAFGTVESDCNRFDFSWKQIINEHCCAAKIGSNDWKKNKKNYVANYVDEKLLFF